MVELLGDPLDFLINCFGFFLGIKYPASFLLFKDIVAIQISCCSAVLTIYIVWLCICVITLKCLAVVMNLFSSPLLELFQVNP